VVDEPNDHFHFIFSADRRWLWDGAEWRHVSPDGRHAWDGAAWRTIPLSVVAPSVPPLPAPQALPVVAAAKLPWYRTEGGIVSLAFLCPPLGMWWLWKKGIAGRGLRFGVTAGAVCVWLVIVSISAAAGSNNSNGTTTQGAAASTQAPAANDTPTLGTTPPPPVTTVTPTSPPTPVGTPKHASAAPAPTAAPTTAPVVVDASGAAARYNAVFQSDAASFVGDASTMADTCSNADFAGCRAGAVALRSDSNKMLGDLRALKVPSCLGQADGLIRQALGDYVGATGLIIRGIDNLNVTQMNDGTALMETGNTLIGQATGALPSSC
jgi:hypothetical protein